MDPSNTTEPQSEAKSLYGESYAKLISKALNHDFTAKSKKNTAQAPMTLSQLSSEKGPTLVKKTIDFKSALSNSASHQNFRRSP